MSARRIAAAVVGAEIGLAGLFGAFGVLHTNAVAYADTGCFTAQWEPMECPAGEIALSEIHNVDMFPVCELEDCSDQPGQVGMWLDRDTGNWRLSLGESSLLVVDDSVAPMR
jgi:hypothetical protein